MLIYIYANTDWCCIPDFCQVPITEQFPVLAMAALFSMASSNGNFFHIPHSREGERMWRKGCCNMAGSPVNSHASIWLDGIPSCGSPPLPFLEKDLHLISCFHLVGWNLFWWIPSSFPFLEKGHFLNAKMRADFLLPFGLDGTPSSGSPPIPFLEKDHFLNAKMRAYHLHLISSFHLLEWNLF